jgi:hypothetical protein
MRQRYFLPFQILYVCVTWEHESLQLRLLRLLTNDSLVPVGACRHPQLSLGSYDLQILALCQYSKIRLNSIQFFPNWSRSPMRQYAIRFFIHVPRYRFLFSYAVFRFACLALYLEDVAIFSLGHAGSCFS